MNIKRIPRPIGLTHLSHQCSKTNEKALKKKLNNTIIKAFISEALLIPEVKEFSEWSKVSEKSGKLNQGPISPSSTPASNKKSIKSKTILVRHTTTVLRTIRFDELASCLGWSIERLEERIQKVLSGQGDRLMEQVAKVNYEAITRVHQTRLFFRSLEGLEKASTWAEEVKHVARIGGYRASTIMATNSAMGTELQFLKMASDQASKLSPKAPNIHQSRHIHLGTDGYPEEGPDSLKGPNILNGSQYLTPSMAMRMLEEKGHNPIPSHENGLLQTIALDNGLYGENLVSVSATLTDAQGKTSGFRPLEVIDKINHNNRRASDYGIVDDLVGIEDAEIEG